MSEPRKDRLVAPGCQYIAGEPNGDDDCKCGTPIRPGSVYCTGQEPI